MGRKDVLYLVSYAVYIVSAGALIVHAGLTNEIDRHQNAAIDGQEQRLQAVETLRRNAWSKERADEPAPSGVELAKLRLQLESLESRHADLVDYYRRLADRVEKLEPKKTPRVIRPPDALPALDPEHVERMPPIWPPLPIPGRD